MECSEINNNIKDNLKDGDFLSIELSPSLNQHLDFYLKNNFFIKILSFISNIIVTDSPLGKYTHNPILTASYIQSQTNIQVISTFAMRDKNTPYSLSEIRTAEELNLCSYMFVTGDKTKDGKNVYEKSSTSFLKDVCIQKKTHHLNTLMFSTCSNVLTSNVKKRIRQKILNGADVIVSQPITSINEAYELKKYIDYLNNNLNIDREIYLVIGVFPVISLRTAMFIKNNVPGADVNDILIKLLKNDDLNGAFNFNKKIIDTLIQDNFNIHLMTSNNFELMYNLIKE